MRNTSDYYELNDYQRTIVDVKRSIKHNGSWDFKTIVKQNKCLQAFCSQLGVVHSSYFPLASLSPIDCYNAPKTSVYKHLTHRINCFTDNNGAPKVSCYHISKLDYDEQFIGWLAGTLRIGVLCIPSWIHPDKIVNVILYDRGYDLSVLHSEAKHED